MSNALEIKSLRKAYKGFALKDVSFVLPKGSIMGLVGPNGAGKTTIIKLILNLVARQAGEIKVFGLDNLADEKAVKTRIGFVHETPALVEDVALKDIASATAPFYPRWDNALFQSLLAEFELPPGQKFKKLSHGMKMKFSLALALCHDADLLVLDEPTSGLDPVFRRELLERLSGVIQDEGKAVLFSTHITSDLERTADYITLIHDGAVVFSVVAGLLMAYIFRREDAARDTGDFILPEDDCTQRSLAQEAFYLLTMVLILIFAAWAKPAPDATGLWPFIFSVKWYIVIALFMPLISLITTLSG